MVRGNRLTAPDSLGSWLLFYRQRTVLMGQVLKPELAAPLLGVSSSTLRRWENNVLAPKPDDVRTLGQLYQLNGMETSFLLNCLLASDEQPAEPASFAQQVTALLNAEYPALLVDQLFRPVAWN